jgi:membrane protein
MVIPQALKLLIYDVGRMLRRMFAGFWEDDGYILSGHLAYLALLGLFPFAILIVWVAGILGRSREGLEAIETFLLSLPVNVADVLRGPITEVTSHISPGLLTLGLVVGVWTTGSVIETIRVVIHKAYNHAAGRPFWQYRLQSTLIVVGATLILLLAMGLQFTLAGTMKVIGDHLPAASSTLGTLTVGRDAVVPVFLFLALYLLFWSLTPRGQPLARHWPGALLITLLWMAVAVLLPRALANIGTYSVTYGSLAGVMITLLFFYLVGAGLVFGAQLNAGLTERATARRAPLRKIVDLRD